MIMSFNVERRNSMIETLVDNDYNTIMSGDANDFLVNLLTYGHKGYEDCTDDELVAEMNERDLWDNWFKETL
jgi:hypothetical protein